MFVLSEPCMRPIVKVTLIEKSPGISQMCPSLYVCSYSMVSFFLSFFFTEPVQVYFLFMRNLFNSV